MVYISADFTYRLYGKRDMIGIVLENYGLLKNARIFIPKHHLTLYRVPYKYIKIMDPEGEESIVQ